MMEEFRVNGAIRECIVTAFGRNGELAEAFISTFLTDFVAPFKRKLSKLTFRQLISRKNPYLYRASGISSITELVDRALGDFVSSSTEGMFGTTLEHFVLALPGNIKSSARGVDVERRSGNTVELYAVKSGPAGYNSSSFRDQREHLATAKTILEQQRGIVVRAYVGFAYGRKKTGKPGPGYTVLCSKDLWHKLSGDTDFYRKLLDAYTCVSGLYQTDVAETRSRLLAEAQKGFAMGQYVDWPQVLSASSG